VKKTFGLIVLSFGLCLCACASDSTQSTLKNSDSPIAPPPADSVSALSQKTDPDTSTSSASADMGTLPSDGAEYSQKAIDGGRFFSKPATDLYPAPVQKPDTPSPAVVRIVNTALSQPDLVFAQALEKIYEDEHAVYYFNCIMSSYVTVYFSDGTQADIKTALNSGMLTIEEAKLHGVGFIEKSKNLCEY
jgi:hypothetical protein